MLQTLLTLLIVTPLAGFIACLLAPRKIERLVFSVAISAVVLELGLLVALGYQWIAGGQSAVTASLGTIYASSDYKLDGALYFDVYSAVFLGMATILTALVLLFARYYMHREQGFKRFFATLMLFFFGLSCIILAGNFEVLFVGWEIIGISSVLLIAFYRDRFLPARNALKVFSVYRIADACLLAAIWYAHHIFEQSAHFADFSELATQHGSDLTILGLLLLFAALVKSAQFPFSYWLPRAMEGPTTSSAIFYGALSVHMGLFLLLRTYPLWEDSVWVRVAVALFGLATALIATSIARVQSSAKTQIAYASISQIGIMFIEVALGLHWLALLHFVSNASLRTYQLLISPSIVGYLVHDQFFNFAAPAQRITNTLAGRLRASLYVLSIKEWNMDAIVSRYFWMPLKGAGRRLAFLDKKTSCVVVGLLLLAGAAAARLLQLDADSQIAVAAFALIIAIFYYARAFTTKANASLAWSLVAVGHVCTALFLVLATDGWRYLPMYATGLLIAYLAGLLVLRRIMARGQDISLREYQGCIYPFKRLGNLFFLLVLVFVVFPVSPSFLGQDILLSLIAMSQWYLTALFCAAYLCMGISVMRLYIKVFFGPHPTNHHEKAYRSS